MSRGFSLLGLLVLTGGAWAQDAVQTSNSPNTAWQAYDWLKPGEEQKQATSGETFSATVNQNVTDPFAVLSTGALWQDNHGSIYTRRLDEALTLSCESNSVTLDGADDLSRSQKLGFLFAPVQEFTLRGDLHDSACDQPLLSQSTTTTGAGFSIESRLPQNTVLTLGVNSDRTEAVTSAEMGSETDSYDAQLRHPIGNLPLTAVFKGSYADFSTPGAPAGNLPSLEQSLEWKPLQNTTLQAGLRQQQYQEYPGIDHLLNEALFADWSQTIVENVSWHSYAEVLNSRGLLDQAPATPIASGANGTAQATVPGSNASLTDSLPISVDDQTLTFSTGPSFRLQKDISASLEYSNRWDKNPAPGSIGQEQRVSVSVKGTF